MKVAALDLGSNTFLCLIAEVSFEANQGRIEKVYSDSIDFVRLGQGLNEAKKFHPDALARAEKCFQNFSAIIKENKPDKILAMATSAARDAENRDDLFKLGEKYQIPIEIIPGSQEAQITYQGATSAASDPKNSILVIDIGGGSTEFIFGQGPRLLAGESYNIGCVRLTEKFISSQPTSETEINNVRLFIREHIQKAKDLQPELNIDEILAVAGTPTMLVEAELGYYDANKIDGFVLTKEKLTNWLSKLKDASVDEKIKMGIKAGRADVILIGVITLLETLNVFNKSELKVSTRGVRYGVALEMARRYFNG